MPARSRVARKNVRRVAVYARLSVTTEESVSIERQVEAARRYAQARDWEVVLVATDDGVSATKNRPEDRLGWRTILDSPESFEAVIVWKVDRLARRVLDFLHADEALQDRGAGLVAVEDPVDMTTPQGRAFATMLAVFGEMEAAAISARVKAAREALIRAGRRAGGRPPYGYRNVPSPDGPGLVLAKDPDTIPVVSELAGRALAGASLYALCRWLEESGVSPRPREGRTDETGWRVAGVDAILRNPVLAGMTPYRGDVLRDADGLPIVDDDLAVMTPDERRRLVAALDDRRKPGSRPGVGTKPSLLSGLVVCGSCERPLHRATVAGGLPYYRCQNRACPAPVGAARAALEAVVEDRFLRAVGRFPVVQVDEVAAEETPRLAEVEAAIADTLSRMAEDDADVVALAERLASLKALRIKARSDASTAREVVITTTGETFAEAWAAHEDVAYRRTLLGNALDVIVLDPASRKGGRFDAGRVHFRYRHEETTDLDGETAPANREWLLARHATRREERAGKGVTLQ